jgi:murein DD-endopeptidase MepM/ murein hydrolase activator NlpD
MSKYHNQLLICAGFIASTTIAQVYTGPVRFGDPLIRHNGISQKFGVDWSENQAQAHTGIDMATPRGNRVLSIKEGKVQKVGDLGKDKHGEEYGSYVVIINTDQTINGYLHVNPSVRENQKVEIGQEIGTVFKDHLHLNQCKQADGCQHGAFPNRTFPKQPKRNISKYYADPKIR